MSTPAPEDSRLASARLLVELVNTHLDPGYAAAAARRGPNAPSRRYDRPAVAFGCLLIGFVLIVAYIHTHRGAPAAAKVHAGLVHRVHVAEQNGDDLAARVTDLESKLSAVRDRFLPSGQLSTDLALAQLQAGEVAAKGPGVLVTLREPPATSATPSPGPAGAGSIGTPNILTDRDVRSVVNELWHDGAEAMSVNDVRLTPTSAIRFAGEAVLVDFQAITPPYRIRAIGAANALVTTFAESAVASRYQTLSGVEHIGFSFTDADELDLPASAPLRIRYARVPGKQAPR